MSLNEAIEKVCIFSTTTYTALIFFIFFERIKVSGVEGEHVWQAITQTTVLTGVKFHIQFRNYFKYNENGNVKKTYNRGFNV